MKADLRFPGDTDETLAARDAMVDHQLVARGIRAPLVLEAFRRVPRHIFCSSGTSPGAAYGDHPLSIGCGQTISQPLMVAEMTERLQLQRSDRVLEVGTGSGYQAALLALLVAEVHTVERIPELAESAEGRFRDLGLTNIAVHVGDGSVGWPDEAPYDGIIVTAGSPEVPGALKQQLRDGGRLAIPVGPRHMQELILCRRHGDRFDTEQAGGCRFVPLIGQQGWPD